MTEFLTLDTFKAGLISESSVTQTTASGTAGLHKWTTAGSLRWEMGKSSTAESTGNVGSEFGIIAYSDTGTLLGTPLSINRTDGVVLFQFGMDANTQRIKRVATPAATDDATPRSYVDLRALKAGDTFTGPVILTNGSQLISPLTINRTVTSTSTSDADTFVVNYLAERSTWTNEKGNLRTSNKGSKGEVAMKIIAASTAEGGTGNMLEVTDIAGNIQTRIGPLGRQNFYKGVRMVGDTIEIQDSTGADQSTIAQITGGNLVITPKAGRKLLVDGNLTMNGWSIDSGTNGTIYTDYLSKSSSGYTAFQVLSNMDMVDSRILNVGTPTATKDATNKAYVDARTPKITVATTAPGSPAVNDVWIDTT